MFDDDSSSIYYKNNKNLMSIHYNHPFTRDEITEMAKCAMDPIYFINNFVKIVNLDEGLILFKTRPFQDRMVESFHMNRNTIAKVGRQAGKSTICAAYYVWCIIFQRNCKVAMLANKESISKDLLSRVKLAIEHLPLFLKPQIMKWDQTSIKLVNGSEVIAAATSASAIRGMAISILHIDEMAFIPNNIVEEFFLSVYPTISSGKKTKCIIVSTPCGFNYYHKLWKGAEQGKNGFIPIAVDWWEVPGRDEAWKKLKISEIGDVKFAQEYSCDFLGSSNTLIAASAIGSLVADEPLSNSTATLKVYKEPEKERTYLITVDVAEGLDLDDSAFIVFDITEYPIRIMAVFKDNKISPQVYPQVIETIAKHYNDAYVLVENNSIGTEVTGILYRDFEYENMVIFGAKNAKIGMKTNKQTKRIGCSNFKDLVENQKLIINDEDLISQISTFIQTGTTYKADIGFKDDLVMACVLLGFYSTTTEFKHLTNANIRAELQKDRLGQLEEEIVPFGIIVRNGVVQESVSDRYGVWVPQKFDRWWLLKKP